MGNFCDHCNALVHPDVNGFWVGSDDASECDAFDGGHEVEGRTQCIT